VLLLETVFEWAFTEELHYWPFDTWHGLRHTEIDDYNHAFVKPRWFANSTDNSTGNGNGNNSGNGGSSGSHLNVDVDGDVDNDWGKNHNTRNTPSRSRSRSHHQLRSFDVLLTRIRGAWMDGQLDASSLLSPFKSPSSNNNSNSGGFGGGDVTGSGYKPPSKSNTKSNPNPTPNARSLVDSRYVYLDTLESMDAASSMHELIQRAMCSVSGFKTPTLSAIQYYRGTTGIEDMDGLSIDRTDQIESRPYIEAVLERLGVQSNGTYQSPHTLYNTLYTTISTCMGAHLCNWYTNTHTHTDDYNTDSDSNSVVGYGLKQQEDLATEIGVARLVAENTIKDLKHSSNSTGGTNGGYSGSTSCKTKLTRDVCDTMFTRRLFVEMLGGHGIGNSNSTITSGIGGGMRVSTSIRNSMSPVKDLYTVTRPVSVVLWLLSVCTIGFVCLYSTTYAYSWSIDNNNQATTQWILTLALVLLQHILLYRTVSVLGVVYILECGRANMKTTFNIFVSKTALLCGIGGDGGIDSAADVQSNPKPNHNPNPTGPTVSATVSTGSSMLLHNTCLSVVQQSCSLCIVSRKKKYWMLPTARVVQLIDDLDVKQYQSQYQYSGDGEKSIHNNILCMIYNVLASTMSVAAAPTVMLYAVLYSVCGYNIAVMVNQFVLVGIWSALVLGVYTSYVTYSTLTIIVLLVASTLVTLLVWDGSSTWLASDAYNTSNRVKQQLQLKKQPTKVQATAWMELNATPMRQSTSHGFGVASNSSIENTACKLINIPDSVRHVRSLEQWGFQSRMIGRNRIKNSTNETLVKYMFGYRKRSIQYIGGDYSELLEHYLKVTNQLSQLSLSQSQSPSLSTNTYTNTSVYSKIMRKCRKIFNFNTILTSKTDALNLLEVRFNHLSTRADNPYDTGTLPCWELITLTSAKFEVYHPAGECIHRSEWICMHDSLKVFTTLRPEGVLNYEDYSTWFIKICQEIARVRSELVTSKLLLGMHSDRNNYTHDAIPIATCAYY